MLARLHRRRTVAQSAHQTCTAQVQNHHSTTRPPRLFRQRPKHPPVNSSNIMPSCIVLTSLDAKAKELQPLLAEAQSRQLGRVYVTTSDLSEMQVTQQLIDWLAELYNATAAVNPRLDVIPCLACAGWSTDKLGELSDVELLISSTNPGQQAEQLQQQLNQQRSAETPLQLQTVDAVVTSAKSGEAAAEDRTVAEGLRAEGQSQQQPDLQPKQQQQQRQEPELLFQHVAVGGTFDRLHAGHRLLLAATALVDCGSIYIGVTSDALLAKKSNKQLLQGYEARQNAAVDFMVMVRPAVTVTAGALTDPAEPTQAELDPDMQALVVSQETVSGGEAINQGRLQRGFEPLQLVVVGLIGGRDARSKLSSTALRDKDAAAVVAQ